MTTNNIAEILIKHQIIIKEFIGSVEYIDTACLEIS